MANQPCPGIRGLFAILLKGRKGGHGVFRLKCRLLITASRNEGIRWFECGSAFKCDSVPETDTREQIV